MVVSDKFLIASRMNFNFESNRFFEVRHNAPGERPGNSLIDDGLSIREVKVIGSSE